MIMKSLHIFLNGYFDFTLDCGEVWLQKIMISIKINTKIKSNGELAG